MTEEQRLTITFTPDSIRPGTVMDELTNKLDRLGHSAFALRQYEGEEVMLLYIEERLICSQVHALSLSDESLKALIDETVAVPGD